MGTASSPSMTRCMYHDHFVMTYRSRSVMRRYGSSYRMRIQVLVVDVLVILTRCQHSVQCAVFSHRIIDISQVDVINSMVLTV